MKITDRTGPRWRAQLEDYADLVTVRAAGEYEFINDTGVGDAHDFAVKNAVSYAVKRCAKDLGDQFGLALYNRGQTDALVGRTLVMPDGEPSARDVEEHAPAPQSLGNDEREHPTVEGSA